MITLLPSQAFALKATMLTGIGRVAILAPSWVAGSTSNGAHLSRPMLGNDFSTCAVFVNLVSQRAERNPEQLCRGSAAPTLVFQRFDNEFALDLRDRVPDEMSNGLSLICGKVKPRARCCLCK